MPDTEAGMGKQDLKKLLQAARRQPVNCAVGNGKDGCLIVLNKVTPAKALLAQLKKDCPELKGPLFGTAAVDVAADPKLVTFQLNKAIPGLQRRLKLSLKGTGFTKVAVEKAGGRPAPATQP